MESSVKTLKVHGRDILIRLLAREDAHALLSYFENLSVETKKRYAPHPFDRATVDAVCADPGSGGVMRFIAQTRDTNEIVGYALVKLGHIPHDAVRIEGYGVKLDEAEDAFYAPSVADAFQGSGLGSRIFEVIIEKLEAMNIRRLILWGGVQATNSRAVRYYEKNGFVRVGEFEYNGPNIDMVRTIAAV